MGKCSSKCLRIKFKMQSSKLKITNGSRDPFGRVYRVVRRIPPGKVATYGQIARLVQDNSTSLRKNVTPRIVGFALHANRDSNTPCHRVVNKDGRLAPGYAFNGPREQKRRLEAEGVKFKDETHVDLKKHLWLLK
jgi:methylated-DNA-protein-cysteine methyltransferase-like protein